MASSAPWLWRGGKLGDGSVHISFRAYTGEKVHFRTHPLVKEALIFLAASYGVSISEALREIHFQFALPLQVELAKRHVGHHSDAVVLNTVLTLQTITWLIKRPEVIS